MLCFTVHEILNIRHGILPRFYQSGHLLSSCLLLQQNHIVAFIIDLGRQKYLLEIFVMAQHLTS